MEAPAGDQRRYRRDTLRRVALIRIAQRAGIPLAEVRAALTEPNWTLRFGNRVSIDRPQRPR